MKIANTIVIGALLGSMTLEEVVKAIEISQGQHEQVKLFVSDDLTNDSDSISDSDDS